ncbi:transglycosylase SLT domain-containing protein [Hydrogenophaga palleronii]|uniref:transglycosylase SLT domain-containing protein n=1 Tax=Hydrogenophaga palleronii TaxID=65655 RepID=UPI00286A642B|nr:transglycosylase SLT domain-containing protein [Hydrogenophaga palleronii]
MAVILSVWLAGCSTVPTSTTTTPPPTAPTLTTGAPPQPLAPVVYGAPLSEIGVAVGETPPVLALAAPADIWDRIRRGFALNDLQSPLVNDREQWYASRPDYIFRMTDRSRKYLFHIVEEIERRDLPMELALLPFIESAFNPRAVSSARAAGMWQFMPATGQSFDLKQNAFRDDRRDVLASTRAALDYLEQLYRRFGDWHLALAAYNWGQGNVNRAITRNTKEGLPTGYTDLSMPYETREYVPKLQAVKNIVADPKNYGVELPPIGNHPFFDTVTIDRDMDVDVIANLAEVEIDDFRALNPSLNRPVVMAAGTPNILLPWDNAAIFENRLKTHTGPLATWTAWVVPTTMTPAQAASRVGMSEAELRRVNAIPPRMMVRAGSSLLVPRTAQRNGDVPIHVADNGHLTFQPESASRRTVVRVRKGDTLTQLAGRYGVSPVSVAGWNKIAVNAKLKVGQQITLMLPHRAGVAKAATKKPVRVTKPSAKPSVRKSGSKPSSSSKRPPG